MKTMIFYESPENKTPIVILAYDDSKVSPSDICEHVFTMLETLNEADGFRMTHDLYEISEEIKPVQAA